MILPLELIKSPPSNEVQPQVSSQPQLLVTKGFWQFKNNFKHNMPQIKDSNKLKILYRTFKYHSQLEGETPLLVQKISNQPGKLYNKLLCNKILLCNKLLYNKLCIIQDFENFSSGRADSGRKFLRAGPARRFQTLGWMW